MMAHNDSKNPPSITRKRVLVAFAIAITLIVASVATLPLFGHSNLRSRSLQASARSPKPALLLSFPKAGTSQTMHSVHVSSGTTTATNYGEIIETRQGEQVKKFTSIPINEDFPNGPFRFTNYLPLPDSYILTRTHCSGYCLNCPAKQYVLNLNHKAIFRNSCGDCTHFDGKSVQPTRYGVNSIDKFVVSIRNPVDIVVSRFNDVSEFTTQYSNTKNGFQSFCKSRDFVRRDVVLESYWYEQGEFRQSMALPCHAEFFKIIHWYDRVFDYIEFVQQRIDDTSVMVVRFEDFVETPKQTSLSLTQFLELPWKNPNENEILLESKNGLNSKAHWYSAAQLKDIASFFKQHASPDTWDVFKGYLEQYL